MADDEETTQELRMRQQRRVEAAREQAERLPDESDTAQFERRADKAAYLRDKLEERARSERKALEESEDQ